VVETASWMTTGSKQLSTSEASFPKDLLTTAIKESKGNLKYFHGRAVAALGAFYDDCALELDLLHESLSSSLLDMETSHQFEVAKLRAEMAVLKDRLGMPADPTLPQALLVAPDSKKAVLSSARGVSKRTKADGVSYDPNSIQVRSNTKSAANALRSGMSSSVKGSPSGTWQHFIAWIPGEAGLGCATPWKGVPDSTHMSPDLSPMPVSGLHTPSSGYMPIPTKSRNVGMSAQIPNADASALNRHSRSPSPSPLCLDPATQSEALVQKEGQELHDFELLEGWHHTEAELARRAKLAKIKRQSYEPGENCEGMSQTNSVISHGVEIRGFHRERGFMKRIIIHPHCYKRVAWDVLGLLLVIYDMVTIPLEAFDLGQSAFLLSMEWMARLFWTLDIAMSFLTGIVKTDGHLDMRLRPIASHYMRTWFSVDLFIVSADWLGFIIAASGLGLLGRASRVLRIIRVVRLLRLMKLAKAMEAVTERIQSEGVAVIAIICKLVLAMVAFAHLAACLWWIVGQARSDSWVGRGSYDAQPVEAQYLLCLHWALRQLSGGMDEVMPGSSLDRLYAIFVWVCAFTLGIAMVSIFTSKLTQLSIIESSQSRNMAVLRKYLTQNSISRNLALRVQRSAKHALLGELTPDMVDLLQVVSEPLRIEMHHEMYSKVYSAHPFFSAYLEEYAQESRKLCRWAMTSLLVDQGDIIFTEGEAPRQPKMYIVMRGALEYEMSGQHAQEVYERRWVSEAALWTHWQHAGKFSAASDAKLVLLDATAFQEIACQLKHPNLDPKVYAADFITLLNSTATVTDLMEPPLVKA